MRIITYRDHQILRIAVPSIVSNITVPLLGLMDVAITGHLGGAVYVGAIAVGGMLFNIIYWIFAFLRMGTSGMTAQALGERNLAEVVGVLARATAVALALSALLLCLQVPIRNVALSLINPSPDVAAFARAYYNICVWGAPAALMLFVLNGWYVGMQNSRTPMLIAIVQNVANIALSLLMVYGLGMKIEGVAAGTVLAQYVGLAIGLAMLRRYSRLWEAQQEQAKAKAPQPTKGGAAILRGRFSPFRGLGGFRRFFMVNKDIFFRTICLIFVHFYFIAAGARFGNTELAVNTLLMQLYLLYSYIMDGFAYAGEAMVGKAVGAQSRAIMTDTVRRLFVWGCAMIALFTAVYAIGGKSFLCMLSDDADVVAAAMEYHEWTLLFPVCGMMAFIWDGVYIGATATKGMLLAMMVGMATFFALFHIFSPTMLNHGLWLAFCGYILSRGLTQTLLYPSLKLRIK